jgi:hypothetical protein
MLSLWFVAKIYFNFWCQHCVVVDQFARISVFFTVLSTHLLVVRVDGARLCLRTVATSGPVVHSSDGITQEWKQDCLLSIFL